MLNMTLPVASRWRYDYNPNKGMLMCSGQDSYKMCEVWGRLGIVCMSYSTVIFCYTVLIACFNTELSVASMF